MYVSPNYRTSVKLVAGLSEMQATETHETNNVVDKFVIGKSTMPTLEVRAISTFIALLRELIQLPRVQ